MADTVADDAFVREHEGLVRKQARRLRVQLELTVDEDELIAYGMQGLLEAKHRYDPERGVRFGAFAYYRIRGAILDGVREMAYLPRRAHHRRRAAEALDRAAEEVALDRARTPEARADAKKALAQVDDILGRTCAAFVISAVGQDDDDGGDGSPESSVIAAEERARVRSALDVLDDRERALVEGYYLEGETLDSVGQALGMSKSWASRVCSRALKKMRAALEEPEP